MHIIKQYKNTFKLMLFSYFEQGGQKESNDILESYGIEKQEKNTLENMDNNLIKPLGLTLKQQAERYQKNKEKNQTTNTINKKFKTIDHDGDGIPNSIDEDYNPRGRIKVDIPEQKYEEKNNNIKINNKIHSSAQIDEDSNIGVEINKKRYYK